MVNHYLSKAEATQPERRAKSTQSVLVDQGYQNYGGCHWVLKMYKKTVRAQQNPIEIKTLYLFLAAKMKNADASGMGTILLREFTEGSLLISSSSNCPSSSETVSPHLDFCLILTCFSN